MFDVKLWKILIYFFITLVIVMPQSSIHLLVLLLQPFYGSLDFVWDYPDEPVTRKVKPWTLNESGFTGARDSEWQWHHLLSP